MFSIFISLVSIITCNVTAQFILCIFHEAFLTSRNGQLKRAFHVVILNFSEDRHIRDFSWIIRSYGISKRQRVGGFPTLDQVSSRYEKFSPLKRANLSVTHGNFLSLALSLELDPLIADFPGIQAGNYSTVS